MGGGADTPARVPRVRQNLERSRRRSDGVDAVGLCTHQVAEPGTALDPCVSEAPPPRAHDSVVGVDRVALVQHADQGVLRPRERPVPPACRGLPRTALSHRVECSVRAVSDLQPIRPGLAVFEPDSPVHRVGTEEGEVRAAPAGLRRVPAHTAAPVLVVSGAHQSVCAAKQPPASMKVDAREVGQGYVEALGQHGGLGYAEDSISGPSAWGVVGAVVADRPCPSVPRGPEVEAVPTPPVVGLPGGHRRHDGDLVPRAPRADDQGDG